MADSAGTGPGAAWASGSSQPGVETEMPTSGPSSPAHASRWPIFGSQRSQKSRPATSSTAKAPSAGKSSRPWLPVACAVQ